MELWILDLTLLQEQDKKSGTWVGLNLIFGFFFFFLQFGIFGFFLQYGASWSFEFGVSWQLDYTFATKEEI